MYSCALTRNYVEHPGVENGRADQAQEDKTTAHKQKHFAQLKYTHTYISKGCKPSNMVSHLTTLVRIVVLAGHFCCTDFCRHPYIYLKVLMIKKER